MSKIYLVSDSKYSFRHICKALCDDVDMFQLRFKNASSKEFYKEALKYKKICKHRNIKFIINDRLDIALAVNADGLHVGQDDLPLDICRRLFKDKIIGVSCRNLQEAKEADSAGADYIGVGAMFETTTKDKAKVIGVDKLKEIKESVDCRVVAIGGIDTTNYTEVYQAGADALAVCSTVLGCNKPQKIITILKDM